GRALKFYSSVRVDVRKISTLKEGENTIGIRMRVKIVKNKIAPPFRQAEFDMLAEEGISLEGDVIDLAIEDRIIDRTGSWLSYGEVKLGQGRDKARVFLKENPHILDELLEKVKAARNSHTGEAGEGTPDPEEDEEPEE
ncbi:MAG: DNA recombination/repair protein RecA, partial [Planctomycetaceae bacterium]